MLAVTFGLVTAAQPNNENPHTLCACSGARYCKSSTEAAASMQHTHQRQAAAAAEAGSVPGSQRSGWVHVRQRNAVWHRRGAIQRPRDQTAARGRPVWVQEGWRVRRRHPGAFNRFLTAQMNK